MPSSPLFSEPALSTAIEALCERVTDAVPVSVTFAPLGGVPVPVAVFSTLPALTSAWVTLWVPVQASAAPGASVAGVAGVHDNGLMRESVTVTPVRLMLPLFVAVIL